MSLRLRRLSLPLVLVALLAASVQSQEPKPPEPTPEQIAAAEADKPTREQTIYIPYAKLRSIFEKEGRGVFVPYDEFQRMWKAARDAARRIEEYKPPIGALIAEIDSQATVSKDVMNVQARLQIEVLTEGWHEVPLRLTHSAIRSAKIGDQPARLIYSPDAGYRLLVEKKGKQAERIELVLEYSRAFTKQPGTNSVEFDAPQAPVNRWQIRIAEPGVKVNVHPNISTTDAGAEKMGDDAPPDPAAPMPAAKETLVQAFVGAADVVRIDWTAKAEGAAGLAALVTVQARQEVTIDEGVVRTRVNLAYDITRADVTQLTVEVPADHNVVNVYDPNVQKWEKKTEGPLQTLTITLYQPTRGAQNVMIELEKFAGDKEMPQEMMHAEIKAPVVRALQAGTPESMTNIGRQQGVVVVRLGTALRGEVTSRTGLLQIDAAELPAPLAGQEWNFAYRYAALPFDLVLSVEKLLPQIEVEELVEAYVEPNQITLDLLAVLNIERAGVFQIELEIPEGYDVRAVQGRDSVSGALAVAVDSFHVDEVEYVPDPAKPEVKAKKKTKLLVNLARRALGRVALWVELQKRQEDPNLLQPTGTISVISLPVPRVQPASVARTSGRVLVYAPESLRINPKEVKGLRPISVGEALANIESTRGDRFPGLGQIVAYAYTQEPASLIVEGQRRKPYIEARELLSAHIESGVVRFNATFFFDIKYSGVKSLRIDVPAALAGDIRNLTPALREQRLEPQPMDVAEKYVAWQIAGEGELLGSVVVKFEWEKKLEEMTEGQSIKINLPLLKAVGVDRFWGQITASKAETIEIAPAEGDKGLRPIDPQRDLMPGAEVTDAARAWEFQGDWQLALTATRYKPHDVKHTSIDRAFVRMVVTRGDQVAVQALYRLRSARQRIAIKLPGIDPSNSEQMDRGLDSQSLRINNQPVNLESDQKTQFYIPLTGHSPDEEILVELRYTVDGNQSQLDLPEFPEDPAVQRVDLAVYLPEELKLLGVSGPWTDESSTTWIDRPFRDAGPDDDTILHQLRSGIVNCELAGEGFPLDGDRYLFSALRPAPAPDGSLRLTAVHRYGVYAAVFLLVAITGLILTPRPAGTRLWWLAGLIVLIVLIAVFAPTLTQAILGWPLYLAIGLVLLVWLVRCLAWCVPGCVDCCSSYFKRAATAATAATVVAATASPTTGETPAQPVADAARGDTPFAPATPPVPPAGEQPKEGGASHG
jgi:hypothetical protein